MESITNLTKLYPKNLNLLKSMCDRDMLINVVKSYYDALYLTISNQDISIKSITIHGYRISIREIGAGLSFKIDSLVNDSIIFIDYNLHLKDTNIQSLFYQNIADIILYGKSYYEALYDLNNINPTKVFRELYNDKACIKSFFGFVCRDLDVMTYLGIHEFSYNLYDKVIKYKFVDKLNAYNVYLNSELVHTIHIDGCSANDITDFDLDMINKLITNIISSMPNE